MSACGDDGAAPADAGVDTAGPIDAAVDAAIAPICGNGQMEQGEECDDGLAGLSHDGCSSTCKVEALTWRNLTPNLMVPRWNHAMAFDTSRSTAVMFGGVNTQLGVNAETFEWDAALDRANADRLTARSREACDDV